jgi:NAD-dependent SIR2 family protein deacetylase
MTGAGISVSAGIPDFRSPGTGLYDNLKEYDLPYPEAIFDIDYFKKKPQAFYKLAESFLSLDKFEATPTHHFCKMLYDKEMVKHYLTQNIDNLESKAGFTQDQIVQAHGANFGAVCAKCGKKCE